MCTELILALLYFLTIFTVNYFLFKLLQSYISNIFLLLKLKNIFVNFSKKDIKKIAMFYFYNKKTFTNPNFMSFLNQFSTSEDCLILGKTYEYLSENIQKIKGVNKSYVYYLQLLKNQYLS